MPFTGQQGEDKTFSAEQIDVGAIFLGPGGIQYALSAVAASGALAPNQSGNYEITKAGIAALTLAAPTSGANGVGTDGAEITITSNTGFAHTLTATGLLQTGSASVNVATFAAFAGAGLTLMAVQGKWNVICSVGITFS